MILTFEKIRDLYWKEKDSQKLQEIPDTFFRDAAEYLNGNDETIKNAINDLIDNRQSKILKMASMSLKSPMPPQNLTREEEIIFQEILESLRKFRSDINQGKIPNSGEEVKAALDIKQDEQITTKPETHDGFCMIKESLPSFIGSDMKTYHLKKGDKVYLPKDLMNMLAKKGLCERLN